MESNEDLADHLIGVGFIVVLPYQLIGRTAVWASPCIEFLFIFDRIEGKPGGVTAKFTLFQWVLWLLLILPLIRLCPKIIVSLEALSGAEELGNLYCVKGLTAYLARSFDSHGRTDNRC